MTKDCSISNHVISVGAFSSFFLLFILLCTASTAVPPAATPAADTMYNCANLLMQPVTREFFMHGSKESNLELVESTDEFVQQCHGFQQFDQTMKAVMLSNMREEFDMNLLAKSSTSRTNVHIYDFRLVTGDVYLDLDSTQRDNKNDPLIINLVARQFVTFNLFNLPSDLSNVTILLSGECNLEVRSKQEWLKLNVAHAPVYDEISGDDNYESTAQPNQAAHASHRTKWMSYLSRQLGIETRYYVEHLTMLCHVRHLFIGSSHNSVLVQYSDWNYEDSSITEYLLIKKCVRKQKLPASASTSTPTPSRIGDEPIKDEFYLFEFDSNQKEKIYDNETIRIYLKDCAFNKRYNLIVLFNLNSQKLPRMILDTDICRLNILYSNVDITDVFGVKWCSASKQRGSKDSVVDSLGLNSYYQLKLVDYAAGIELRFNMDEATDKMIKTTHAFSNLLALQLFVDESRRPKFSSYMTNSTSIKFLLADKVVKAHFLFRNLNLDQFVKSDSVESKKLSTRFIILDANQQPCPLIYLRQDRTSEFSLLFNSDLFEKCAIPYDIDSETYMLTLKFNFYDSYRSKFHSSYFTIKAKHVDQFSPKTGLDYRTKMINQIRKKAKDEYFNSVIANTLESHYTSSTELYTGLPHQEARTDIELASLDDLIRWQLGKCWLMSMFSCNNQRDGGGGGNHQPDALRVRREAHEQNEEKFGEEDYDDTNHELHDEDGDTGDSNKDAASQNLEFFHRVKHTAQSFDYKKLTAKLSVSYEFNSSHQSGDDDTDKFLVCNILPCEWNTPDCSSKQVDKQRLILINYFNSTHSPHHYYITPAKFFFNSSISFIPSSQSSTSTSKCLSNIYMIYEPPTNDTTPRLTKRPPQTPPHTFKSETLSDNSAIVWLKDHTLSLSLVGLVLVCILVCLFVFKLFFKNFIACYHEIFKKKQTNRETGVGGEQATSKSGLANGSINEPGLTHHSNAINNHISASNKTHLIPTSLEMEDKEQSEKLLKEPVNETTLSHNDSETKRNFVTNV